MKYRRNKVKREHGIIQNALLWLEDLGRLSEVTDIIPGVIEVSHSSDRGIVYKYETQTGCKLLLKSNGSIQEVFVVTKDPTCVKEWVRQQFSPDSNPSIVEVISKPKQSTVRSKLSNVSLNSEPESKKRSTPTHSKRGSCRKSSKPLLDDKNALNVADHLDRATLKALTHLKKLLETESR